MLLLTPSVPLTVARVANLVTGSVFAFPSIGSGARIGPGGEIDSVDSETGVLMSAPPFLLFSLMFIASGLPSTFHRRKSAE